MITDIKNLHPHFYTNLYNPLIICSIRAQRYQKKATSTCPLMWRFELFRYLKKTLLVGVDVEADFLSTKGAAVLKGLVGGDWFDAEQKGGTGCFQVQGNFNVVITSNARLKVRLQGDVAPGNGG